MDSKDSLLNKNYYEFILDDINYSIYAEDFLKNEDKYYNIIKSYNTRNTIVLTIRINDMLCSSVEYKDGFIYEHFRNDIHLDKINEFSSITNWVNDYYGEIVTPHCILNSVYIGNYNVPIWKILVDEKEMDDINDGKKEFSSSITALMILLLVGLMLFSIFTIIITTIRF